MTLLVRAGSAVDAEDENLSTPAMLAALGGHPHCVHELVGIRVFFHERESFKGVLCLWQVVAGADVTRKNINDDSAYSLAVKHGARAVQTVLENHMLAIISGGGAGGGAGGGPVQRI